MANSLRVQDVSVALSDDPTSQALPSPQDGPVVYAVDGHGVYIGGIDGGQTVTLTPQGFSDDHYIEHLVVVVRSNLNGDQVRSLQVQLTTDAPGAVTIPDLVALAGEGNAQLLLGPFRSDSGVLGAQPRVTVASLTNQTVAIRFNIWAVATFNRTT